jgi:hypothetical protein
VIRIGPIETATRAIRIGAETKIGAAATALAPDPGRGRIVLPTSLRSGIATTTATTTSSPRRDRFFTKLHFGRKVYGQIFIQ